ncbi:Carboxy-S-adenosyl-L-methionine synthase, partial [Dissostichus eleginoides]
LCEAVLLFRCREDLRVDSMWDRYEHSPLQQDTSVCVLQVVVNIIGRWCVKPAVLVGTLKATSQIKDSSSDNLQGIQKKLHQLLGTCEIPDRSLSLVSIPYVRSSGASEAVNMSLSPGSDTWRQMEDG